MSVNNGKQVIIGGTVCPGPAGMVVKKDGRADISFFADGRRQMPKPGTVLPIEDKEYVVLSSQKSDVTRSMFAITAQLVVGARDTPPASGG